MNVVNLSVTGNNSYISQIALGNTSDATSISTQGVVSYKSSSLNLTGSSSIYNNTISPASMIIPSAINGGINFSGINGGIINTQIFTANGTWIKPEGLTGKEQVLIMMWGAGGAGRGGGGACFIGTTPSLALTNTCEVSVGGQGDLGYGNNSFFVCNSTATFYAYGGGANAGTANGAGGGGWVSAGDNSIGGQPMGGDKANSGIRAFSVYGGGVPGNTTAGFLIGGASIFGGGGSATSASGGRGNSIFGGAGGGVATTLASGYSVIGGDASVIPGGGATGGAGGNTAQHGARGEVRVWILGARAPAISLYYVNSNNATSTSNTVVIPPQANVGDIAIFTDRMQLTQRGDAGTNVSITPTGFTNILTGNNSSTSAQPSWAWNISYKQLEQSDLNATVTGMSDYTTMRKTISLFRPSRTPLSITAVSAGISATSGTPSQRTITANTNKYWDSAILAVGYWDSSGAGTPTTTTSVDMTPLPMSFPTQVANTVIEYKIYQQGDGVTRDAITLDASDTGAMTALAGFYIKVT